jgi:hypothetical protein
MWQKHSNNANLTIEELKAMIRFGHKNQVLNNMQRYMSDIPGTPCYSHKQRKDPGAKITFKVPLFQRQAFFTYDDQDLHRL